MIKHIRRILQGITVVMTAIFVIMTAVYVGAKISGSQITVDASMSDELRFPDGSLQYVKNDVTEDTFGDVVAVIPYLGYGLVYLNSSQGKMAAVFCCIVFPMVVCLLHHWRKTDCREEDRWKYYWHNA